MHQIKIDYSKMGKWTLIFLEDVASIFTKDEAIYLLSRIMEREECNEVNFETANADGSIYHGSFVQTKIVEGKTPTVVETNETTQKGNDHEKQNNQQHCDSVG